MPFSTWILFGSSQRTRECFDHHYNGVESPHQINPFEVHVLLLDMAVASWRPYLIDLQDTISDLVIQLEVMLETG